MTSKQKPANRNEKSQGEFQKKDETKRVPQAQEIDNSREITIKKELLEAQTNTSRSASSSSFISSLFQDHSFSDRIFKTKNSVFFLMKHTAYNTLLYKKRRNLKYKPSFFSLYKQDTPADIKSDNSYNGYHGNQKDTLMFS